MGWFGRTRTAAEQRLWDRVYLTAVDAYTSIEDYDDADARKTANAALAGWFSPGGRRRILRGLSRLPDPGNLLSIGDFIELHFVQDSGRILMDVFSPSDGVELLWSADLQACFIFPGLNKGACTLPPTRREDRLARVWAKGRPAKCASPVPRFPTPPLPEVYPGIAITYDSDKFTHGRLERYIHHFGPGVRCYTARTRAGVPPAIMVRGGKLRLTEHGLAG
jgi:hypothetical protein